MTIVWFSRTIRVVACVANPGYDGFMPIKDPEKRRAYMRAWRQARTDSGQCWDCQKPATGGTNRCEECAERVRQQSAARRSARRVQGKCIICGKDMRTSRSCCADCTARQSNRNHRFRDAVLDHYGRECVCCGESEVLFLCLDHVENDGAAHRREHGTGSKFMEWVVRNNYPSGLQTLCWNCNAGKHLNGGTCPHQTDVSAVAVT